MSPAEEISMLQARLLADSTRLAELQRSQTPRPIPDYELHTADEPVKLSEFFFESDSLIVVHNMGSSCPYCTMWADGFAGLSAHLQDRAGFLLVSPDTPEVLETFANDRGWLFPVASDTDGAFTTAMGMKPDGHCAPGFSTFWKDKESGQVHHIASEELGPMDLYNPAWHMISRLKDGINDWEPQFRYAFEEAHEHEGDCSHGCGCHH
jgi:predicted dithiol-disulfide oxidoreductase (DUF899 family)